MTRMIPVMALMTLAACGVSSQKVCDRSAECYEEVVGEAPPDGYVDECVTNADQAEADADEAGCSGEYKSYQKCAVGAECDDATACESEFTAYRDCLLGGGETGTES